MFEPFKYVFGTIIVLATLATLAIGAGYGIMHELRKSTEAPEKWVLEENVKKEKSTTPVDCPQSSDVQNYVISYSDGSTISGRLVRVREGD